MDPAKARQAITTVPAKVAGLTGRIGAIAPDHDADLVVFSGDPLRLDVTVQEVYVRGVRVYTLAKRKRSVGEER
jgi:imidazolonepropionase-like amidohydrolase